MVIVMVVLAGIFGMATWADKQMELAAAAAEEF
jgi:hypothetical protein